MISGTRLFLLFFLISLVVWSAGFAADGNSLREGPLPTWFAPALGIDIAARSQAAVPTSGTGLEFLLFDQQFDVETDSATTHIAFRITSEAGLAEGAQINRVFDPSFQSLEFHFLKVWREGEAQDRLNLADFKLIQQERDLERQMFNGELSALVMLSDIRVGDIIDYACTTHGANSVFGGKFFTTTSTGWGSPVDLQRVRVRMPVGRELHATLHGDRKPEHTVEPSPEGGLEYTWTFRALASISADADTPGWHVQYPYLEISEYRDWAAVRDWALPLYAAAAAPEETVRAKAIALTRQAHTPEAKVLATLDFVQREVRYLGIELGVNSHRPHPPEQVLRQRFGDCKDKVLLFCSLLSALEIQARPVLVHSYQEKNIERRLPSPCVFNHVIALVELGGERYWLDPTQTYARGPLKARDAVRESRGLVVTTESTNALATISPRSQAAGSIAIKEVYRYEDFEQPAILVVHYRYAGERANGMRAYLSNRARNDITRDFLDRLKRNHTALTITQPISWKDNSEANTIEVDATCQVSQLWKKAPTGDVRIATFYPWPIHNLIIQPDNLTRHSPLALSHPEQLSVETEIHLKGAWNLQNSTETFDSPWYDFTTQAQYRDQVLSLLYVWRSHSDHVPVEQLDDHVAKLAAIRKTVGYSLSQDLAVTRALNEFHWNWRTLAAAAFVLLVGGALVWLRHRRSPLAPPPLEPRTMDGLGGWLILPAIGLVTRPLFIASAFYNGFAAYFDERIWITYTTPGLATYQPLVAALLLFEVVGNTALLVLVLTTAFFFFRRKRESRALYIALLVAQPVVGGIDIAFGQFVTLTDHSGFDSALQTTIQGVIVALVWIPYFTVSRRVRETFTR